MRWSILSLVLLCCGPVREAYSINLLENSSFELGLGHGWGYHHNKAIEAPLDSFSPDNTTAAHGKCSFRIIRDGHMPDSRITYKAIPFLRGCILSPLRQGGSAGSGLTAELCGAYPTIRLPETELTRNGNADHVTTNITEARKAWWDYIISRS